jgi:hypothetical protein
MRPGRGSAPNPFGLRIVPATVRSGAELVFVYAEPATVSLEIRNGSSTGPLVRQLGIVSPVPRIRVRLRWDGRDDGGRRLARGTYVAVARIVSGTRAAASTTAFDVR